MGNGQKSKTSFSNVKGGEHRNIMFNLEIPSVGDMGLSVKLDAVCKKVDLLAWANPGAEDILPEDPSVNLFYKCTDNRRTRFQYNG